MIAETAIEAPAGLGSAVLRIRPAPGLPGQIKGKTWIVDPQRSTAATMVLSAGDLCTSRDEIFGNIHLAGQRKMPTEFCDGECVRRRAMCGLAFLARCRVIPQFYP
jgi:hypothetical protein